MTLLLFTIGLYKTQAQEPDTPTPTPGSPPIVPFIVGGSEASPGAWPWQVALIDPGDVDPGPNFFYAQFCGGSLIKDNWVLTAAHCVYDDWTHSVVPTSGVNIVVGVHNLQTPEAGYQQKAVAQIIVHENYDPVLLDNDLALLKLATPVTLGLTAGGINVQLVPPVEATVGSLAGTTATVTGWGTTSSGGSSPAALHQVQVPIISNAQCENWYDTSQGQDDWVTNNMLCAGYALGGKDSCQGDSGGPLVISDGASWKQAGIVSWGIGCARAQQPGVYTRLSQFAGWIAIKLGDSSPPPNFNNKVYLPLIMGNG